MYSIYFKYNAENQPFVILVIPDCKCVKTRLLPWAFSVLSMRSQPRDRNYATATAARVYRAGMGAVQLRCDSARAERWAPTRPAWASSRAKSRTDEFARKIANRRTCKLCSAQLVSACIILHVLSCDFVNEKNAIASHTSDIDKAWAAKQHFTSKMLVRH